MEFMVVDVKEVLGVNQKELVITHSKPEKRAGSSKTLH
jgi:hypothetical protein